MDQTQPHAHPAGAARDVLEARVRREGLRMTPSRRRVLDILLESRRAIGAYDILDRLAEDGERPKPPTAYRALDFLTRHGLAHRIERLNAYVACDGCESKRGPAFLICADCRKVDEIDADAAALQLEASVRRDGFEVAEWSVELLGRCAACAGR